MHGNSKSEEQRRKDQGFLVCLNKITSLESDAASAKGAIGQELERVQKFGFSKKGIKFAQKLLKDHENKLLNEFREQVYIADLLGHAIGRQADFFPDDRTPVEERAYQSGWGVGIVRGPANNPHGAGTLAYQKWQEGFNDGTEFVNVELSELMTPGEEGEDLPEYDDEQTDLEDFTEGHTA